MPPHQATPTNNISPHNSSTPLISTDQRRDLQQVPNADKDSKSGKRKFFGLGGKKKEDKAATTTPPRNMEAPTSAVGTMLPPATGVSNVQSAAPLQAQQAPELKPNAQTTPASPSRLPHQAVAASPSRLRSSSPRLHSPASSEIFERNVQEPIPISNLAGDVDSAHIPSHVMTEDSIPPALEASAQAITSEELNPDEVEIVTSASHQPAVATLETSPSHADLTQLDGRVNSPIQPPILRPQMSDESDPPASLHQSGMLAEDDSASNYGQLDPNDVRRLSFISFKDIVNSEHQQMAGAHLGEIGSRDSLHMASLPPSILQQEQQRAASPLRSPRSPTSTHSRGLTTPPPGASLPAINPEQSPVRSVGLGSPGTASQHGELTIETMRQALRKTASGDLGVKSATMSPVSDDLSAANRSRTTSNT